MLQIFAMWSKWTLPTFSLVILVFFITMLFPVFPPFLLADGFFLLCETLESTCQMNVIPQPFLQIGLNEHQCFNRSWCHGSTVVGKHNPANTEQLLNNVIGCNNKDGINVLCFLFVCVTTTLQLFFNFAARLLSQIIGGEDSWFLNFIAGFAIRICLDNSLLLFQQRNVCLLDWSVNKIVLGLPVCLLRSVYWRYGTLLQYFIAIKILQ